jgi:hypothetical protein
MADSISTALALIDDRLAELHALMTDEPIDVVTGRYRRWKNATSAALADIVVESVVGRFDLAGGRVDPGDGRRPTPPVYLDGAASRDFLMAMKKDLEADAAAVLLLLPLPPSEPIPAHPLAGIVKVINLLERRLPRAFRGRPETERDVQNGFETLLAGAEIAYERESDSIVHSSRTYVPDFTFSDLQAALELKLCSRHGCEKEITAEINDEILAYRARYPRIIFGVYDLGFIRDPDQFSRTFETGVLVSVIMHEQDPSGYPDARISQAARDLAEGIEAFKVRSQPRA